MEDHGFTMTAVEGADAPDWPNFNGTSWTVTLKRNGASFTTAFHQGIAHTGPPQLTDVVSCILSDITADLDVFENWAADYGYDTDSRKAYKVWEQVRAVARGMRPLIGSDDVYELLEAFDR